MIAVTIIPIIAEIAIPMLVIIRARALGNCAYYQSDILQKTSVSVAAQGP